MIWFPIIAAFFSILFSVALIVPTFVLALLPADIQGPAQLAVLFVTYFGLAFIATFSNTCVVYTTKVRLSGGDATFFESIAFAFKRIHLILAWSLVSASVGLFLRMLDAMAERAGLVGKILLSILRAILASAWSLMTMFVIPSMVYRGLGPFAAIKDSMQTLRNTWGESLFRYYGVGFAAFLCSIPCIALILAGFAVHIPAVTISLVTLGLLGLLTVSLVFSLASTVFNTALYHYATTGVPAGFDAEVLRGAFRQRTPAFSL
jgi:hypothetical protein